MMMRVRLGRGCGVAGQRRALRIVACAAALVACSASTALATISANMSPPFGLVGQTATFTMNGDGASTVQASYAFLQGGTVGPGVSCPAFAPAGATPLTLTPSPASPGQFTAPLTPTQAGVYCIYFSASNGGMLTGSGAMPWEADPNNTTPVLPPGAKQYTFHVVDQRGWPQAAYAITPFGPVPTDAAGNLTLVITPGGQQIQFTRDPVSQPKICSPMESRVSVPVPSGSSATVVLKNTTGNPFNPTLSSAERGVAGELNSYRASHGLPQLAISTTLSSAAAAVAHDSAVSKANTGAYPFPPPFCDAIAQDYNWPSPSIASLDASTTKPQTAYAHWTDGSARGQQTLSSRWNSVGIGDGGGAWIVIYGTCPSGSATRCGMTTDLGDPHLYPNAVGTPQVPGSKPAARRKAAVKCHFVTRHHKRVKICTRKKSTKHR
jgi:uncharacterized protein YkwD